jgi:acyl-CoA reductase-like NAD-dependent aldehyde dehydrogenase
MSKALIDYTGKIVLVYGCGQPPRHHVEGNSRSELTSVTSGLMKRLVARYFDEAELAVVTGGADIGAAFTGLAFDHLIFTGGTAVGRHVARAAADNLTPLTLELGGKSPVIVSKTANLSMAAERIMTTKTLNAGQICLANRLGRPGYFRSRLGRSSQ